MNKYQKAAALDLIKITGIVIATGITMNILAVFLTVPQIITALMFALLIYTGYTLFQIRVDQHKSLDELTRDRK
jgi:uncharacterized membrane protein